MPPDRAAASDVHVGRDGWLFLIGGSNSVLTQYRRSWRLSYHYWQWRRLLERRHSSLARLGILYRHLVVPEKLSVYDHMLGSLQVDIATSPAAQLRRMLTWSPASRAWIDVVEPMRAQRDRAALYLRTDSHWTHEGCFIAYETLCSSLGVGPNAELRDDRFRAELAFCGDLGSKLAVPPRERARVHALQRDAVRTYASPLVLEYEAQGRIGHLHVGTHVVFRNESARADPRRLVLFGDSYANFRWNAPPGMLTGMLAETFREVHFLWSATIDWDYVRKVRPDIVITEIAERFLGRLPRFDGRIAELEERARALKSLGQDSLR